MTANIKALPIAVLGAGSWGTALAILLARNGQPVRLWDRDPENISRMYHQHSNPRYLPDITFPDQLEVFANLEEVLHGVRDILIAVPSVGFRDIIKQIQSLVHADTRIVWGTKGLDPESGDLLHLVAKNILGDRPIAIISGPSFAREVALGLPTAVTLANNDKSFAQDLVDRFHNAVFRIYLSTDLIGVQICAAAKNVLAVAVGASDGLGFGANARCALITRGVAEMMRLVKATGGKVETAIGLPGIGDLVLTATDDQSRNRRFGFALGSGKNLVEVRQEIGQVVEGADNAAKLYALAQRMQVEMPIIEQVNLVINENVSALTAMKTLLSRDIKEE